jgi:hypothetical protein
MIFSFLNTSPFQMFFLISPESLNFIRKLEDAFKLQRLFLKFIVVIPWQALGWLHVKRTLHPQSNDPWNFTL